MTLFEMMSGLSNGGQPGGGYDRTVRQGKGGGGQPQGGIGFGGVNLSPGEAMRRIFSGNPISIGRGEFYARGGTQPDRTVRQGKGGGASAAPAPQSGGRMTFAPETRIPGAGMDRQTRQGK